MTTQPLRPVPTVSSNSYEAASKFISSLVGHECIATERAARHKQFREAVGYVDQHAHLQLDAADAEVVALMYTMLSENKRFTGVKYLDEGKGENPATHSLHGVVMKERLFMDTLQRATDPNRKDAIAFGYNPTGRGQNSMEGSSQHAISSFNLHSKLTGLGVASHDMGEVLGELLTVHKLGEINDQRAKEGLPPIDKDPKAERQIFGFVLRLAINAQERGTPDAFFAAVETLREKAMIRDADGNSKGVTLDAGTLAALFAEPPALSAEGEKRAARWMSIWDLAEYGPSKENPQHAAWEVEGANLGFVAMLVKSLDHLQGSRHMIRMGRREDSADGQKRAFSAFEAGHLRSSYTYLEREQPLLFEALGVAATYTPPQNSPAQMLLELARTQASWIYNTARDLADLVAPTDVAFQLLERSQGAPVDRADKAMAKRAQGEIAGLYRNAGTLVMRGDYVPEMVKDANGSRPRILANDGVSDELHAAIGALQHAGTDRGGVQR